MTNRYYARNSSIRSYARKELQLRHLSHELANLGNPFCALNAKERAFIRLLARSLAGRPLGLASSMAVSLIVVVFSETIN